MLTFDSVCPRILAYRSPRIAIGLLLRASAAQFAVPAAWGESAMRPVAATAVGLTGFVLMLRAWWLFKIQNTAICPTAKATTLITSDLYRLTRNPMYLGMVMMPVRVGLYAGHVFYCISAAAFFLVIDHSFCPYEERKLRLVFGEAYEAYATRVRRWL